MNELQAAIVTLTLGGLGSALKVDNANTVVALGWGGIAFSFLVIVLGAVALWKPKGAGIGLIVCSLAGAILGGTIVAVFMAGIRVSVILLPGRALWWLPCAAASHSRRHHGLTMWFSVPPGRTVGSVVLGGDEPLR